MYLYLRPRDASTDKVWWSSALICWKHLFIFIWCCIIRKCLIVTYFKVTFSLGSKINKLAILFIMIALILDKMFKSHRFKRPFGNFWVIHWVHVLCAKAQKSSDKHDKYHVTQIYIFLAMIKCIRSKVNELRFSCPLLAYTFISVYMRHLFAKCWPNADGEQNDNNSWIKCVS